ncbi:hypothetical protein PMSD_18295 [Paenibacillus macquariensis subsp. defensor]|nr:hypothetical protein PMSD_18295 [Paenibacillus macquariensis subsp. defensor]
MRIPTIYDANGRPVNIDSNNLLYVSSEEDKIELHTRNEAYRPLRTLKDWEHLLHNEGFTPLAKSNLVNMKLLKKYDEEKRKAFFDIEGIGKSVEVSRRNIQKISRFLDS